MKRPPLTWLVLAAPAAWIAWRYLGGAITYGEAVHETGDWSVRLLILTLAVTPLQLMFGRAAWTRWLMQRRRALGVASFGYALFHTVVYLVRKAQPALILDEGLQPDLLTGWIALAVFAVLAATSNDAAVRALRSGWKRLHRLVYPAAALALAHWLLTAFDPTMALIHAAVLAALEAVRLALTARRRRLRR